jgi:hypothetical protein
LSRFLPLALSISIYLVYLLFCSVLFCSVLFSPCTYDRNYVTSFYFFFFIS